MVGQREELNCGSAAVVTTPNPDIPSCSRSLFWDHEHQSLLLKWSQDCLDLSPRSSSYKQTRSLVSTPQNLRCGSLVSTHIHWLEVCCCSVTQKFPTLCNPMDCSTPSLPVLHHLLKFAQVHVHCINDAIQPSHLMMPSSSALNLSQQQGLFQ